MNALFIVFFSLFFMAVFSFIVYTTVHTFKRQKQFDKVFDKATHFIGKTLDDLNNNPEKTQPKSNERDAITWVCGECGATNKNSEDICPYCGSKKS